LRLKTWFAFTTVSLVVVVVVGGGGVDAVLTEIRLTSLTVVCGNKGRQAGRQERQQLVGIVVFALVLCVYSNLEFCLLCACFCCSNLLFLI
jgi:hypothetical protein